MSEIRGGPFIEPPIINAHQFREWADAAASYRDDGPFWLVHNEGEAPTIVAASAPPPGAVFGVATREVEERPTPTAVIVDCDGSTRDLADTYDALFWSEAAVEKFVFPYYASKSLWDAAAVLDKLSLYWYGKIPIPQALVGITEGEVDEPLVPYAIAHTPDSDWNILSPDGIGALGADVHLLVRVEDAVRAVRLSDLPEPPRHAGTADHAPRRHAATAGA